MDSNKKRIIVVGMGYVGMSMATMLSCKNTVIFYIENNEKRHLDFGNIVGGKNSLFNKNNLTEFFNKSCLT